MKGLLKKTLYSVASVLLNKLHLLHPWLQKHCPESELNSTHKSWGRLKHEASWQLFISVSCRGQPSITHVQQVRQAAKSVQSLCRRSEVKRFRVQEVRHEKVFHFSLRDCQNCQEIGGSTGSDWCLHPLFPPGIAVWEEKKKPINLHRASCNNVCTLPSMPQKFEKDKVSVTLVFDRSCTLTGNLSNCPG